MKFSHIINLLATLQCESIQISKFEIQNLKSWISSKNSFLNRLILGVSLEKLSGDFGMSESFTALPSLSFQEHLNALIIDENSKFLSPSNAITHIAMSRRFKGKRQKAKVKSEEPMKLSVFVKYATSEVGFTFAFCLLPFLLFGYLLRWNSNS